MDRALYFSPLDAAVDGDESRERRRMADVLAGAPDAAMATACHPIEDPQEAFNPHVVKVALDHRNYAMYFSRATIPWARDAFAAQVRTVPAGLRWNSCGAARVDAAFDSGDRRMLLNDHGREVKPPIFRARRPARERAPPPELAAVADAKGERRVRI